MLTNLFFISSCAIFIGIMYGLLFYFGKKHLLSPDKKLWDILFTALRLVILFALFYIMSAFIASNSILLIILFVSSYLSTVAVLTYNS